jgi:hypothetical protein
MTFTVKRVVNGWVVEIWRGRTEHKEHVFADRAALLEFIGDLVGEEH